MGGVKCSHTDSFPKCGDDDGRKKKAIKPFPTWTSGSAVEVAYQHRVGHGGGGYSYRICPADTDLNEDCFAKNALSFADDYTWFQYGDDTSTRMKSNRPVPPTRATWVPSGGCSRCRPVTPMRRMNQRGTIAI